MSQKPGERVSRIASLLERIEDLEDFTCGVRRALDDALVTIECAGPDDQPLTGAELAQLDAAVAWAQFVFDPVYRELKSQQARPFSQG